MSDRRPTDWVNWAIQIAVWLYVGLAPLFYRSGSDAASWEGYLRGQVVPLTDFLMFYLNYLWLAPRFLVRRPWVFAGFNLAAVAGLVLFREWAFGCFFPLQAGAVADYAGPLPRPLVFRVRSLISLLFAAAVASSLRLALQWRASADNRREAELVRTEAELEALNNQINPHFLLNTLNNIYALTAINADKAQAAILELSRMLRYLLYERVPQVSLTREAAFLADYVSLMQLRLPATVSVEADFGLPDVCDLEVAPMIFISLVENAFKHGISPTQPSFIRISLKIRGSEILFSAENSCFAANKPAQASSGIGLRQVARRLELSYKGRYTWQHGTTPDRAVYFSHLWLRTR